MIEIKTELFIPGELKNQSIICDMIKNFNIDLKIIEASFSTESGWAYLVIKGEDAEVERAFSELREKGVNIEVRDK